MVTTVVGVETPSATVMSKNESPPVGIRKTLGPRHRGPRTVSTRNMHPTMFRVGGLTACPVTTFGSRRLGRPPTNTKNRQCSRSVRVQREVKEIGWVELTTTLTEREEREGLDSSVPQPPLRGPGTDLPRPRESGTRPKRDDRTTKRTVSFCRSVPRSLPIVSPFSSS